MAMNISNLGEGDSKQLHIGVILKQLMVAQLVNKFHALYGSHRFITDFSAPHY